MFADRTDSHSLNVDYEPEVFSLFPVCAKSMRRNQFSPVSKGRPRICCSIKRPGICLGIC